MKNAQQPLKREVANGIPSQPKSTAKKNTAAKAYAFKKTAPVPASLTDIGKSNDPSAKDEPAIQKDITGFNGNHHYNDKNISFAGGNILIDMENVGAHDGHEENYAKSKDLLQAILESKPGSIIFSLDRKYCYTAFTKSHRVVMKEIWGVDIEVGMDMLGLIGDASDREHAKFHFDKALAGEQITVEEEYGDEKLSRSFWENKYFPVYNPQGEIGGVTVFVTNITEIKKKENESRDTSEKYQSFIEQAFEGLMFYREDGEIVEFNDKAHFFLGYTREEFSKLSIGDLFFQEDLRRHPVSFTSLKEGKAVLDHRRLKRKDGSSIDMELNSKMLSDGTIMVLGKDISERRKIEIREKSRLHVLELLSKNAPLHTILQAIVDGARQNKHDIICSILLVDDVVNRFKLGASVGLPDFFNQAVEKLDIAFGVGTCCTAAVTGKRVVTENISTNPYWVNFRQLASVAGLQSCWSEPVKDAAGKVVATFAIYHPEPAVPSKEDIDEIRQYANITSIVLSKWAADEKLKRTNEILEEAMQVASVGGYELDVANRKAIFSPISLQIRELPSDYNLQIEEATEFYKEGEHRKRVMHATMRAVELGISFDVEAILITAKSRERWVRLKGKPEFKDGKCVRLFGTIQDIHDRKLAEEAIKKSEEKFRAMVSNVSDIITLLDHRGNITYESPGVTVSLGYAENELIGKHISQYIHPDDIDKVNEVFRNVLENEALTYVAEFRFLNKAGEYVTLEAKANNQLNNPAIKGIVVNSRDISERLKNQQLLLDREQYFRKLIQYSSSAILLTDITGKLIYKSLVGHRITGYTVEDVINMNVTDFLHPDDKSVFLKEFKHFLESGMESTKSEYRIKHKDGHYIWIEGFISNQLHDPIVQALIINFHEITERKTAEEKLRVNNELLRNLLDNIPDPVYVKDLQGRKTIANKEDLHFMYMENEADAIGKTDLELFPGQTGINGHRDDLLIMQKGEPVYNMEEELVDLKNRHRWLLSSRIPLKDAAGNVTGLLGIGREITDIRMAAQALQKSNERFNYVVKATYDAIWDWDILANKSYWGDGFEKMFGHSVKEMNEKNADFYEHVHPVDVVRLKEGITAIVKGTELNWNCEFRYRKANGEYANVQDRAVVIRDENGHAIRMIGAMQDITQRKEAQKQLKLFESIITNTNEGVLITKNSKYQEYLIEYVNEALCKMTGYASEELTGKSPRIFQGPDTDRIELDKMKLALACYQHYEGELVNYKKNGEKFWLEISLMPITDENGEVTHWISIEKDITQKKIAAENLNRLNRQLAVQTKNLTESNKELEHFAYVASHDLQEPLRMVSSFLNLLKKKYQPQLDETAGQYIHFAVDGAERMKKLTRDLLEYSRIHTREEASGVTDMNAVLTQLRQIFMVTIEETGAVITSGNLPKLPNTRPTLIFQLMQNLIGNALKYRGNKVPAIHIEAIDVEQEDQWQFAVKDNGIGIEAAFSDRVFQIFQRLHSRNEYEGTGIGLSICKKIVEMHGGKIWLHSVPGEGSTFYFTIKK